MSVEMVHVHRFPDGESLVQVPAALPAQIILIRSLHAPNDKLIELLLACESARSLGVKRIVLVAPYLCYMRQDKAFQPGEALSQRIVGRFLSRLCDAVVTVDPHLHRTAHLSQAVPLGQHAIAVSAAPVIGRFLSEELGSPIIVGPDEESEQWVREVARQSGFEYTVGTKKRFGDRDVRIELPKQNLNGREVVLVDDVASTGHTLMDAARVVLEAGCARVCGFVTHALLDDAAMAAMKSTGVDKVWSTDSVPHQTNVVSLASVLAGPLKQLVSKG
jgi:ribose-phosphate pyrophosphokinase